VASSRPHVVLGTVTGGDKDAADAKWAACDLVRVLERPEEPPSDAAPQRISLPATSDISSNPDTAAATATEAAGVGVTEVTEVQGTLSIGTQYLKNKSCEFENCRYRKEQTISRAIYHSISSPSSRLSPASNLRESWKTYPR